MTGPNIQHADLAQYAARVRASLSDLSPDEVTELTEDLETHLGDVIAETTEPLDSRLGTPESYAAELRQSAGLPPAAAAPQPPPAGIRGAVLSAAARAETWLADFPAWNQFKAFLPALRPGWWVLRGLIAAAVFTAITGQDSLLLLVLLGGLLAWASVAAGQRAAGTGRRAMPWIYAANALAVFAGLILTVEIHNRVASDGYYPAMYETPGSELSNLYLYDKDGKPLRDVQVFDEHGNPVDLTGSSPEQSWVRPGDGPVSNIYPRPPGWEGSDWVAPPAMPPVTPESPAPSGEPEVTRKPAPAPPSGAAPSPAATAGIRPPIPSPTP